MKLIHLILTHASLSDIFTPIVREVHYIAILCLSS